MPIAIKIGAYDNLTPTLHLNPKNSSSKQRPAIIGRVNYKYPTLIINPPGAGFWHSQDHQMSHGTAYLLARLQQLLPTARLLTKKAYVTRTTDAWATDLIRTHSTIRGYIKQAEKLGFISTLGGRCKDSWGRPLISIRPTSKYMEALEASLEMFDDNIQTQLTERTNTSQLQ